MKKIVLMILILANNCITFAQENDEEYEIPRHIISFGYGWPYWVGTIFDTYALEENYKSTSLGPLYLKYEQMVSEELGLAVNVAYASSELSYTEDSYDLNNSIYEYKIERYTYSILARLNYYFGQDERFDGYVGLGLGYRYAKWKYDTNDPNVDRINFPNLFPFGFETTFGGRYMITKNIGIYAELGLAKSLMQAGVTIKLK